MRDFHGQATEVAAASQEQCFALLAAVDRYPEWCPDVVKAVQVLERGPDGQASRVRMRIRVVRGALVREFDLFLAVAVDPPGTVKLTRVTDHPTNQVFNATWALQPAHSTRIELDLDAKLRVPQYIPADGVADTIAERFVTAACRALAQRSR